MKRFSQRTRRGVAIVFTGLMAFGMVSFGMISPRTASAATEVEGNPSCEYLGYTYGDKKEDPSGIWFVSRDGMVAGLTIGTYADASEPNPNNAVTAYSIDTTAVGYAVVVKGGNGATVYASNELTTPMHAPANSSGKWPTISHVQLCWNGPGPGPQTGDLRITKDVVGSDKPEEYKFEICVTPVGGGDAVCKTAVGDDVLTFAGLAVGTYNVSEKDAGAGWKVEVPPNVVVQVGQTTDATVTNTWIPPTEEQLPPVTPAQPAQPVTPATPATPAQPAQPVTPATPVTPEAPTGGVASAAPTATPELPATGFEGQIAVVAAVVLATGALLTGLSRRRRGQSA